MSIKSEILDFYEEPLLFMDPEEAYDSAIIGVATGLSIQNESKVAYDYDKVIEANMAMGMDYEEAVEYFEFNQSGAYMGEHTPIFITRFSSEIKQIEQTNLLKTWGKKYFETIYKTISNIYRLLIRM